jgi:tetratricopeptide (TPR) repeat protein
VTLLTSCSQTEDVQDDVSNTQQLSSTAVDVKIEETEAVETEPNVDALFPYMSAVNLLSAAQYEDAINQYNKVLRLKPDLSLAYHGRGLAYHHLEQHDLAMEDLNKSIQLDPLYADAYRNRGIIFLNRGELNKGASDINKAMDLYKARGDNKKLKALENLLGNPEDSLN